jgi:DNA-binding transcriptional LysR family regulator
MDPITLNTFIAVARRGSVSAAAEELHTVQSNVTARIKQLEADLGVALFVRHSRGVVPTPAGERLLGYARRFRALEEEARAALRDDGDLRGPLRLGTMETTAAVRLPPLLKSFHDAYPQVQLEVRTGTTAELLQQVLNHQLDGAFVAGPVDHPELRGRVAFREELVLVSAADSPGVEELLTRGRLTVIVFRTGCTYRQRLEAAFAARGWSPYQRLEFGTLDGMLGCVAAHVGITGLPRSVADAHAGRGLRIESLEPQGLTVETLLVRRVDGFRGAAMAAFEERLG